MTEVMTFIENAQKGVEADFEGFIETLKADHPEFADLIDMYLTLYQTYGIEGLASMMNFAE